MNPKQLTVFPRPPVYSNYEKVEEEQTGITLRDWFAGMALNGMLAANPKMPEGMTEKNCDDIMAREAYRSADAMISARSKPTP